MRDVRGCSGEEAASSPKRLWIRVACSALKRPALKTDSEGLRNEGMRTYFEAFALGAACTSYAGHDLATKLSQGSDR